MKSQNKKLYAHSRNSQGQRHSLVTHLQGVATKAASHATAFNAEELAHYLGLWHDLGKLSPAFQEYLLAAEQNPNQRRRGPDHKAAGVRVALEQGLGPLALVLHGHHGGLQNKERLRTWFHKLKAATDEPLTLASQLLPQLVPSRPLHLPEYAQPQNNNDLLRLEVFLRFLFSALVDADFLDTEAHFNQNKHQTRKQVDSIEMTELWARFERNQQQLTIKNTPINQVRQAIYEASLSAAIHTPGIFRLTAPTGGGKTRSALAFALRHACQYGHKRIITALPYTTITEQTTQVYRDIFGTVDGQPLVLEHHSSAQTFDNEEKGFDNSYCRLSTCPTALDKYQNPSSWSRLAAENWDAPLIVTTTVQLFESLFANRPSRCRKVHRLAHSIIILDEVQSLPPHLLEPILSALTTLCTDYGSTVVLCTATQPAFDAIPLFTKVEATEIVPFSVYRQKPRRVTYQWRINQSLSWAQVASELRAEKQVLVIVNTRRDALALLETLDDPNALHLSTYLCGAHRLKVIREVKRRLQAGLPCRLIATQVVEAGVDLDFPLVWRAFGPLVSIAQCAGRANREGLLDMGRVVIFQPACGSLPRGAYERATATTQTLLSAGKRNPSDPETIRRYFKLLYPLENTDAKEIQNYRQKLDFPEVARRFRMIEEVTESVVVPYGGKDVQIMLDQLRAGVAHSRQLLRRLQPYLVSLSRHEIEVSHQPELLTPVMPGYYEWLGPYHKVCGLGPYLTRKEQS